MKFTRYDPSYDSYPRWQALSTEGSFHVVAPSAVAGLLPNGLIAKSNSILVMASGSANVSVFVANINRVDMPASAIDQQPYIVAFDHSASAASGGFIDHGDWANRTDRPGSDFFKLISASGIAAYYPLATMPSAASGPLDELHIDSQKSAFWKTLSALQNTDE